VRPVLKFFLLTYAVTWPCFIVAVAISHGTTSDIPAFRIARGFLLLLGTFAPSLVALWLTLRAEGGKGVSVLFRRIFEWRVAVRWYLFAIVYMVVIKLAVALTHRAITGTWPTFGHELPGVIVIAIMISTPAQAGEEIGWRGYALPRLAAHWGFGGASVVVGLFWACWHLPLFFLPGADKYGQSFPLFLLGTTALSVAIAWLYVHTNGSLLLTMLMHSAVNQTIGIIPDALANATNPFALRGSPEFLLTVTFLCITAAYFLVRMPKAELLRIRGGD